MKVLVIGGVAGGASAAARIRRLDEFAEIIIFEKGPHVSFSNCCLPYFLDRTIAESERLLMMTPEKFSAQYNIDVRTESEVIKINRNEKKITVRKSDGTEYEEGYDRLVLSPGGRAIRPAAIPGIDRENVFTVRNVVDIRALDNYARGHQIKNVAVIGGGFIGCEVAESFKNAGINVALVEKADQIMPPFDYDMAQILHKEMLMNHIDLVLGDGLQSIEEDHLVLESGKTVPADVVVLAIGVIPETGLARDAGLEIGETGGIKVSHNYRTSDKSIYAVGDAIEVFNSVSHKPMKLALAYPAQMEARAAADAICGLEVDNRGFIGSSVVRIFNLYGASTGLNEKQAKANGFSYRYVSLVAKDKVKIMPNVAPIFLKVLFEVPTGKILGAQAVSKNSADRRIDVIAAVISMGGTLADLKNLELCYAPVVGNAKDIVNMAGLVGLNMLNEKIDYVHVTNARQHVEEGAYILDVREKREYEGSHLKTAVNIPLSQMRERYEEIPKDRPVYIYCLSSARAYTAISNLQQRGFDNLKLCDGSFMGIVNYEYANDILKGREPIVTSYDIVQPK